MQLLVLGAEARDLLVSAPTGSGKTVAFGLLLGAQLLGEAERVAPTGPRALVVAPTRELAQQVCRELDWLLAGSGARVGSFTGGTDIRRDARTLHQGVEVVVGTPGRLVDLTQRKSLDLSKVEMVVLDEADEMLDMGFREELETVLGQVTSPHRTLMFSATLPPAIRLLAKRFQQSPLELDPHKGAPKQPHADIRHVAHVYNHGERLAALINVLLFANDPRAVVFCRTREGVAELHRQLQQAGFVVDSISGERAQEERTRALEALRSGRVRVLVATDVAARGLDLPELGLVIHADLPENAESLTHRSGRTGRAGKKGVNVVLVDKAAQRRAERLFRDAHLKLPFTPAPSAEQVAERERERLRLEVIGRLTQPSSDGATALATQLLETSSPVDLVASLLERLIDQRPKGVALTPVAVPVHSPRRPLTTDAGDGEGDGEMVLFTVNLGAKDRAEANWILPLVCKRGAITRRSVGAIRIARGYTVFEIDKRVAAEFAANAAERDPRAPHVEIKLAQGELPPRSAPPRGRFGASGEPPRSRPPTRHAGDASTAERPHSAPPAARPSSPRPVSARPYAARPASERPPAERPRPYARSHSHAPSGGTRPLKRRPPK